MDGTSLVVQWLRLSASTAEGMGSIPGWGTKIPCAVGYGQKKKKKKNCMESKPLTFAFLKDLNMLSG